MQLFIAAILVMACQPTAAENYAAKINASITNENNPVLQYQQLHQKADSLCKFLPAWLLKNNFNEAQVLIADLSLHSGLPRMILVDVSTGKIIDSGMVAHGAGGNSFAASAKFSNLPNSYCSSIGKYRIGNMYKGRFGEAFKLYGLDKTNDKAFERFVVLHSHACVPDEPLYPEYLCNSLGCPTISYAFLTRIKKSITASKKPMLLWIVQ